MLPRLKESDSELCTATVMDPLEFWMGANAVADETTVARIVIAEVENFILVNGMD